MADAREHPAVLRLVDRVFRSRPLDEVSIYLKANVLWGRGEFAEAVELYRIAACLDDKDEGLARAYFTAARHLHRTEETLRFLEVRAKRFGSRSSRPPRTLYWALGQFERMTEAFDVLDDALRLRPDDGELLLFAAEAHREHGQFDRAAERFAAAEGHSRREAWLRTSAQLEASRGNPGRALELWRRVLDTEPAAVDANGAVARLLAETDGRVEALGHLRLACERFPHNFALHQLRSSWLKDGEARRASRHTLTLEADYTSPYHDAWLALDDAIEGRTGAASRRLEGLEAASLDSTNRFFVALAKALVDVQRASRARSRPTTTRPSSTPIDGPSEGSGAMSEDLTRPSGPHSVVPNLW